MQTVDAISREPKEALTKIGEKYNIDLKIGRITYSNNGLFSTRVEGKTDNMKRSLLKAKVGDDVLEKIFPFKGMNFRVTNINTQKRKYPITATNVNNPNDIRNFTLSGVKHALDIAAGKFGG